MCTGSSKVSEKTGQVATMRTTATASRIIDQRASGFIERGTECTVLSSLPYRDPRWAEKISAYTLRAQLRFPCSTRRSSRSHSLMGSVNHVLRLRDPGSVRGYRINAERVDGDPDGP